MDGRTHAIVVFSTRAVGGAYNTVHLEARVLLSAAESRGVVLVQYRRSFYFFH